MKHPAPLHGSSANAASPYHLGEQFVQAEQGVRDQAEKIGRRMLTAELTAAQQEFFAQLPFVVTAHVDHQGQPWAGLVAGEPGVVQITSNGVARIQHGGANTLTALDASAGAAVGLLGIDFDRKRRNRINGTVQSVAADHIALSIDQGYGNCPKYITQRPWESDLFTGKYVMTSETHLPALATEMIRNADTFFIASSSGPRADQGAVQAGAWGADISHRGGPPGFLEQEGEVLWFDDYPGNNMFNTLGNLQQYPHCGLLILDFSSGDLLQLTGRAKLHHDGEKYRVGVTVQQVRHWRRLHAEKRNKR